MMVTDPNADSSGVQDFVERFTQALPAMMQDYHDDPSLSDDDRQRAIFDHLTHSPEWPALKSAARKLGYQERPEVKQLHRVIGGYIDTFSQLIKIMRGSITRYFAPPTEQYAIRIRPLLNVLFATMTANPIVESFFGLSTYVGQFDEGEIAVRNALRRSVDQHVSFRNDIVHADWAIGWFAADTDERVPDTALKIKTQAGVPTMANLSITTNDIIDRINDLQRVNHLLRIFGDACRERQRGEGRVSDVLEAVPASPSGGTVVREKQQP